MILWGRVAAFVAAFVLLLALVEKSQGRMRAMRLLLPGLGLVLALSACAAPADQEPGAAPPEEPSAAAEPSTEPSRCQPVSAELLARIADGAEEGVSFDLTEGQAVRSEDFSEVYMIAARFTGEGFGDSDVGVWASNSLEPGGGLTMSVDGFAQQFTVWPDADKTQAGITQSADGVSEARDCVRAN